MSPTLMSQTLMSQTRGVYRHQDLDRALNPRSIAVVGASPSATAPGSRAVKQIEALGFKGRVYLVNGKYDKIGDTVCYPSVSALPEAPDSVLITTGRAAVEELVLDAAKAGAASAVIYAAGYNETGKEDRIAQQRRLSEIARETGMRIIGPNCFGAVNFLTGAALTYGHTPLFSDPTGAIPMHDRAIGLVSQSGGLGFAAVQALQRGVVFSHLLTSGNSCDVDVADFIAYLAEEDSCKAIACVFEGMPNPDRLLQAADIAWAANKPIVINKLGTGEQGAAAAVSHSGMLAGSHAAYMAAFERAGMIYVENYENLIETASFLAKARSAPQKGVVMLTSSGGASVMCADKAEAHGVPMPQPTEDVRQFLFDRLPDFGTARNPCDVTGGVNNDLETYFALVDALMGDAPYDMMLTAHPYSVHTATRIKRFGELAAKHGKIVNNVWITEFLAGPGWIEAERDPNLTVFRSMDRCFATIAAWYARESRRADWLAAGGRKLPHLTSDDARAQAAALIDAAPNGTLTEREAKQVLAAYGVPVVPERLTQNAEEAVQAAEAMGYPVVMKMESPDLPHKTEAGVIKLNLKSADEVRSAHATIMANAHHHAPNARINGVLVQPMMKQGTEVMIGSRNDPLFGPLIVVGLGGVLVELLKDTQVALAPVTHAEARGLLTRLKGRAALEGFRGSEPVNIVELADIICKLSELAADQRDRIAEFDVNPLICAGATITAVDALIVRKQ